jgi:hypothetical protein
MHFQGVSLADIALDLTATVAKRRRKQCSMAFVLMNNTWACDITGALTVPVLMQYIDIWECLQHIQLTPGRSDTFSWQWEASGLYSCRSSYKALCSGQTSILGANEPWKVRVLRKCIFFLWLTIIEHCWTSERCHRHGF